MKCEWPRVRGSSERAPLLRLAAAATRRRRRNRMVGSVGWDAGHRVFFAEDGRADVEGGRAVAGVEPGEALQTCSVAACPRAGVAGRNEEAACVVDRGLVEAAAVDL